MIALRYKQTDSGKYSVYLDIYLKDEKGKADRRYEFLKIYVSRDYSKSKRIAGEDAEKMELAQSIRSKRELELYGTVSGLDRQNKWVNLSLFNYIREDYQKTNRKAYLVLIKHLEGFTGRKDVAFSVVNLAFIEKFQGYLLKKMSHNSAVVYMGILKKFMRKAYKEEIITFNAFVKHKMPYKQDSERNFLELHEIKILAETPIRFEPNIRDAFLFSCFAGLRISDVRTLSYSHIQTEKDKDGNENTIMQLRPLKTTRTTGQILKVPLSQQALIILKSQKKKRGCDLVFHSLPTKNACNNRLKEWAKDAGITKRIHFHVSRHTFATLGLTSGIDIYTVSKLMGHTRLDATQVYAKIIDEKKRQEVQKFPSFSIKKKRSTQLVKK